MKDTNNNSTQPVDGVNQGQGSQTSTQPPPPQDWHSMRAARRQQKQAWREQRHGWRVQGRSMHWSWGHGGWIAGAVLIIIGLIFLLQTTGALSLHNWWALFLLFPAAGAFGAAWGIHVVSGSLTWPARQALIVGLVLTGISFAFLLGLEQTLFLPILLIGIGVSILFVALVPR